MSDRQSHEVTRRFEGDARAFVPVQDEIGGTAIYFSGRLAYYVLNGEWIQAVPSPGESPIVDMIGLAEGSPSVRSQLRTIALPDQSLSTS